MPDAQPTAGTRTVQRLLTLLEVSGSLTRAELAELAGLPPTTVAGAVAELLREGLLTEFETAPRPGQAGRPPRDVALVAPPRVIALLACLRDSGVSRERLAAVVLSVPHPRPGSGPSAPLGERMGVPMLVENDANLGALGEAVFGVGRGLDSFVYVMLGKGIGAGLVLGGRLHRGASGFAGELAHVQVREQEDGPLCFCGGRGCLARVTGPSVREFVERAYAQRLSVSEVFSLAAARDPGVRRLFADLGRTVGRPLADLCTMLDPAAVVLDGSLGAAGEPVMAGIREAIDRHAAPAVADSVRVLAGELGDRAELLGAVALVRQRALDAP